MDPAAFHDDLTRIPEQLSALARTARSADDAAALIDDERFTRFLVLGMGSSRFAASRVARRARARGRVVVDELASTRELPPPAPDLLVIAVSATGGSAEVLDAVERYRGRGALVAVTNREDSPLANAADAVSPLLAGAERSGVACRTYRHTIAVLDRLLMPGLDEHTWSAEMDDAASQVSDLMSRRSDWVPPLADLLLVPNGSHLLAPAERAGSAQQSALMLREIPRRPAVASETGDWSHIDVYTTLTLDYRAAIFTGSAWDEPAIEWMRSRGSRFATVGERHSLAELTVPVSGSDATRVLVEPLVGELLAEHDWSRDPDHTWSGASRRV